MKHIYAQIEFYAAALRRGLVTPDEAFCAISECINNEYRAWVNGTGERIDKKAALHKAFYMLWKATK